MELIRILSKNRFLLLIIAAVIFFSLRGLPFSFKPSDIGNYIGITALGITIWQAQESKENKLEQAIASNAEKLDQAIAQVQKESDGRDRLHEQELNQIQQQLTSLMRQIEFHQTDLGRLYDNIFENKDKLAEHGAALAVITKQGEIVLAITSLRAELAKVQGDIEGMRGES